MLMRRNHCRLWKKRSPTVSRECIEANPVPLVKFNAIAMVLFTKLVLILFLKLEKSDLTLLEPPIGKLLFLPQVAQISQSLLSNR